MYTPAFLIQGQAVFEQSIGHSLSVWTYYESIVPAVTAKTIQYLKGHILSSV